MSQHLVPAWLADRCELGEGLYERAGALYDSWRGFVHTRGAEPGFPAEFAQQMERRGLVFDRSPPIERVRVRWRLRLQ
jgi:hypothetical protein